MIKAAGILFRSLDGRVLFVRRDDGGDHTGEWAFPGGRLEDGETDAQAARREAREELGDEYHNRLHSHLRHVTGGVDYTTYLTNVVQPFKPKELSEHDAFVWKKPEDALEDLNLHPGAKRALARLDMDELDVAKGIADGAFQSPQFFVNMWLFAIRITGTGLSYRSAFKEHVWRDKSFYLNDRFLKRCQGLPVLWVHPRTRVLTDGEFEKRVIGTIMYPYIKDDEVWGIARIYDKAAAEEMMRDPISTSPGVSWEDPASNSIKEFDDGKKLLIEDDPTLLDHIAVVPNGVWDKGGPPTGVRNDLLEPTERADSMSTENEKDDAARRDAEEKEREDRARKDADAGQKLDKILSCLDSTLNRLDALERKDAEKEEAFKKDAKARFDAETAELRKEAGDRADEDEKEEDADVKKFAEEGEPEDVAVDKARKARKDRMKARKDADEVESKKKEEEEQAAKDAKERDDKARADSAAGSERIAKLERELAAFRAMHRPVSDEERLQMIDEQARADSLCRSLGSFAPEPMAGETPNAYKIRLTREKFQRHSAQWKDVDLSKLSGQALDIACGQIRADAEAYSRSPTDVKPGTLREIVKIDPVTGVRFREFVGQGTFIGQMKRPVRHARLNMKPNAA